MKYILIASSLLLGTVAVANAQTPVELNLKVTPPEADLIWKGLRKLPVEDVENLMSKIRQQVAEQTTPKPVEAPKAKK